MATPERERLAHRMRDVAFALARGPVDTGSLARIQLQKFIYLTDAVGYLIGHLPPEVGHITYKRGPYDAAIQRAVDCLVFRGLVEVAAAHQGDSGFSVYYSLTESGLRWTRHLSTSPSSIDRWEAATAVQQYMNRLGWRNLVSLVYAEPTFASQRLAGYGQPLNPADPTSASTALVLSLFEATVRANGLQLKRRHLIDLFFSYIDHYRKTGAEQAAPEAPR